MTSPAIGTREQRILASEGMGSDRPFHDIRVHLDAAVFEEHDQAGPVPGRSKAHELHTLLPWNWCPINNVELAEAA